jgi:hypothetical protein
VSKGQLNTDKLKEFTESYRDQYLARLNANKDTPHYTLNRAGLKKAHERPLYSGLRRSLTRAAKGTHRLIYRVKEAHRQHCNRTFKLRITIAYATGRISGRAYRRLTTERKPPQTKLEIQSLYATHQISRKQRDYYLRQIDPKVQQKKVEREARWQTWERQRHEQRLYTKDLYQRGLIDRKTMENIETGRLRLAAVIRDLERQGKLQPDRSQSATIAKQPQNDRSATSQKADEQKKKDKDRARDR